MKSALFGLILSAALLYSQAQDDAHPKEGEIKIYKRLIPADVLRGESRLQVAKEMGNQSTLYCDSCHVRMKSGF